MTWTSAGKDERKDKWKMLLTLSHSLFSIFFCSCEFWFSFSSHITHSQWENPSSINRLDPTVADSASSLWMMFREMCWGKTEEGIWCCWIHHSCNLTRSSIIIYVGVLVCCEWCGGSTSQAPLNQIVEWTTSSEKNMVHHVSRETFALLLSSVKNESFNMIYDCFPFKWKNEDLIMCAAELLQSALFSLSTFWYNSSPLPRTKLLDLWQRDDINEKPNESEDCNVQRCKIHTLCI